MKFTVWSIAIINRTSLLRDNNRAERDVSITLVKRRYIFKGNS